MKFPEKIRVFGDVDYRGNCPKEDAEQAAFFCWLRATHPELGQIAFHTRNEGALTRGQVRRHKVEGMTSGVADIVIPGRPALAIELKRRDHTKSGISKDQIDWLTRAQRAGWVVCLALGADAAAEAVEEWLKKP